MNIHADRLYQSYRKYMESLQKSSPVQKKLIIEGKIIDKIVAPPNQLPRKQDHRPSSIRNVIINGQSKPIYNSKQGIPFESTATFESFPSSSLKSSRTNNSQTFTLHLKSNKNRCRSAYSRIQQLKTKRTEVNPEKIFSSVSLLFDRKNLNKGSQSGESLHQLKRLKIHGYSPSKMQKTLF